MKINKIHSIVLSLILSRAITGYSQNTNDLLNSTAKFNERPKQLLILNSWGTGLPIPDETKQGIHIALEAGGVSMNDIFFEDLDLVRSSSSEHRRNVVSLLRHKLEHKRIGIVILIGSSAVELLVNEGKELFPDAALITLITPDVDALKNDPRKIMYLPWCVDPEGSVKLAMELFPKTKHVFVITGANDGILPFINEAKQSLLPWKSRLDFEYSSEMTYEEMIQKAASLTNDTIILYSTFFTDRLNRSFVPCEVVTEVCKRSKVPVFATLEYYMGLGIVGGSLLETERLGKQAGSIALDYLSGQIGLAEHVTRFETPVHPMVDWQELKRCEVNVASIPDGCLIVGKPLGVWEQYRREVLIAISIFLVMCALVLTLLLWNWRMRKMAIALQEIERLLARAEQLGKTGGWEFDIDTKTQTWSDMVYQIHEVDRAIHPTVDQGISFYTPESRPIIERAIQRAIEQGESYDVELEIITAKGNRRHVHAIGTADLERRKVSGFFQDISERKQAEDALKQSEITVRNKLKAIVEPEGDIGALELSDIIDTEVLRSMMEDFYQLTGILGAILDISGKVLVAVGWQHICTKFHRRHPDTLQNCIESDTILTQGVSPGQFKAYKCKNSMWDMVTPLMVGGRHAGNVFIGQFFYEDEKPDVELFREQARLYGFDEKEYLDALDRVPRFSRETVDTGMKFYAKLAGIISTMSFSAIQQSRLIAEATDSRRTLLSVVEDQKLGEEKYRKLNEELEQRVIERTAQLESVNKELEAFSYSVSHDLRAPLRHIDGFVNLLVSHCRDGLTENGLHYLDIIASAAREMGVLIEDLLQFSRTGRAEMRCGEIDMNQALKETLTLLEDSFSDRSIEWVIADLPWVRGEYAMIRQVWMNLLGNAIKYTRSRQNARIEVGFYEEKEETVFVVTDNGAGFDMQYADKLFGVFQRLHTQEEFEGTGIGLATVQRIVNRHEGRIWAEAEVNQGARFYFTLPKQ